MTPEDLITDLSRLLRDGLVQIDESFEEDVERYAITRRGVEVLTTDDDDQSSRIHEPRTAEPETTQRGVG